MAGSRYYEFIRQVEAECLAEGPDAVAELNALRGGHRAARELAQMDALDAIESIYEAEREGTVSLPELRKRLNAEVNH